jgi:hypothetical protein
MERVTGIGGLFFRAHDSDVPLAPRPRLDLSDQMSPEAQRDLGYVLLVSQHTAVADPCRGTGPHIGVVEQDEPAI